MAEAVESAGFVVGVLGLASEGVGALAVVFYPVRTRVPSPFLLMTVGFILFITGPLLAAFGRVMNL